MGRLGSGDAGTCWIKTGSIHCLLLSSSAVRARLKCRQPTACAIRGTPCMQQARQHSSLLFSPFKLRDVTFPNRIVIAPMQMYKAGPDGKATDWHFQHLAKYAVGGAGTIMTEALCVDPIGRNTYGDCGIWSDDHIAPLRRIVDFLHTEGRL